MQKLHFEIQINAPREKVWNTMLQDETYRIWTESFCPGSYFKGDWSEGSKILFLGPMGEGAGEGGMVAIVEENRLHEFVSLKHIGMIMNGVEDLESEAVKKWTPAHENYTFTEKDGGTLLSVDMDIHEDNKAEFERMWPNSLIVLKGLCEKE